MARAQLIDAYKKYDVDGQEVWAVAGVSLAIEDGEFLALAGPSGSGKTTILNLLGCLDRPTRGEVEIDGQPISHLSRNRLAELRRAKLGFIFQTFNLVPVLTAYENVELPLILQGVGDRRAPVEAALREVGLAELAGRRPNEMSGGQQQRVAIARALVKKPALVLADEPTANLDSTNGASILQLMRVLNEKHRVTFVFSTHDPMVISFARRTVTLHDGRVAGDDRRA